MKLIIFGYLKKNLGDDLILKTVIENTDFEEYVLIGYEKIGVSTSKEDKIIYISKSIFKIFRAIRKGDRIAIVGGSVLQDKLYQYLNPGIHLIRILTFAFGKLVGTKNYIIGANISKVNFKFRYNLFLKILQLLTDVWTVRDNYSVEYLRKIGTKNVLFAEDIVFSSDLVKYKKNGNPKKVAISVVKTNDSFDCEAYQEKLQLWIRSFLDNGFHIDLLLFQNEEDFDTAFDLKNKFIGEDIDIIKNKNDDIVKVMSEADYLIASRFHSLILGIILGKKLIVYSYANKNENFLANHNWKNVIVDPQEEYVFDLKRFVSISADIKKLEQSSAIHFKVLIS